MIMDTNNDLLHNYVSVKHLPIIVSATVSIFFLINLIFSDETNFKDLLVFSFIIALVTGFILLNLYLSKWSVPLFLVSVAPLRFYNVKYAMDIGSITIVPLSTAIWCIGLIWFLVTMRKKTTILLGHVDRSLIFLWIFFILSCLPALLVNEIGSNAHSVTLTIFLTGVLEPFMLLLVIRNWMSVHNNWKLLLYSLFAAIFIGFIMGITVMNVSGGDTSFSTDSTMRSQIMGFATANLAGFVLCLMYPLPMLFYNARYKKSNVIVLLATIFMWLLCFFLLSRAPVVVMLLQTFLMFLFNSERVYKRILLAVFAILLTGFIVFVPDKVVEQWSARMGESVQLVQTQLQGYSQLSDSDTVRFRERHFAWDYISEHPFGGMGATGGTDPENIYLDIAEQLGWLPSFVFIAIMSYCLIYSWVQAKNTSRLNNSNYPYLFTSFFGFALYGLIAGSQLSKVSSQVPPFYANASPSVFLIFVLIVFAALSNCHQHATTDC